MKLFQSHSWFRDARGYSLLELAVGVGILVSLLLLTVVNFKSFQSSASLEIEADKFASFLRQAQLWSLSGQRVATERPEGGYGIQIIPCVATPCKYTFFADVYPAGNPDHLYQAGQDILVSTNEISKEIAIPDTTPSFPSTVVFVPPKAEIWINGDVTSDEFVASFRNISGGTIRRVRLNRVSGRVNLE